MVIVPVKPRSTKDFFGLHFDKTQVLEKTWKSHELSDVIDPSAKNKFVHNSDAVGLTIASDVAYLHGVLLRNLRFNQPTNSLSFGDVNDPESPHGMLYFAANLSSYVGHIAANTNAPVKTIRGLNTALYFATQRAVKGTSEYEDFDDLLIGTEWVNDVLTQVYKLGNQDISSRTSATNVDFSTFATTYFMKPGTNPVFPDRSSFTITAKPNDPPPGSTFEGVFTARNGAEYDWKGESYIRQSKKALSAHKSLLTAPVPAIKGGAKSKSKSSFLTTTDLMGISSLQPTGNKSDEGEDIYEDIAQKRSGKYLQEMLISSLDNEWLVKLYGAPPVLSPALKKIRNDHKEWFEREAIPNFGQLLRDNVRDELNADAIGRIDGEKLAGNYENYSEDEEYSAISAAIYVEAYKDSVSAIEQYLNDTEVDWGQRLYDYVTGAYLDLWATQVASDLFSSTREAMYDIQVKLQILCPEGSDLPNKAVTEMLSALVSAQIGLAEWDELLIPILEKVYESMLEGTADFSDPVLQQNEAAVKEILQELAIGVGDIGLVAASLGRVLSSWQLKNPDTELIFLTPSELSEELADDDQWSTLTDWNKKNPTFKQKAVEALKIVAFGGVAVFLVASIFLGDEDDGGVTVVDVLENTNIALAATGFLIEDVSRFLSTKLSSYMLKKLTVEDGSVRKVFQALGQWFSGDGVDISSRMAKVFTTSGAEFIARRLGPAMAVLGIILTSISLKNAIDDGSTRDIVFETMALIAGMFELIFVVITLTGFASFGTTALVFAFIGVLIVVVQLVWSLLDPPKPGPTPIEQYVDGPLKDAGFTIGG